MANIIIMRYCITMIRMELFLLLSVKRTTRQMEADRNTVQQQTLTIILCLAGITQILALYMTLMKKLRGLLASLPVGDVTEHLL